MNTATFQFSKTSGRAILGTQLYATGQRKDATDLSTVQMMAKTDEAAKKTEEILQKLDQYTSDLRFYDGRENDLNAEPGKVAVTDGVVNGKISCWRYYAEGFMEFDPKTTETHSLDIKVHSAPTEGFQLRTREDDSKHLIFTDGRGGNYEFSIDPRQGTITTLVHTDK